MEENSSDTSGKSSNECSAQAANSDLNNLLDDCLDDFNKPLPPKLPPSDTPKKGKPAPIPDNLLGSSSWSEEFKQLNEAMGPLTSDGPEAEELKKLMDSLSQEGCMPFNEEEFAKSFSDTIRELSEQTHDIPDPNPEDLASLLGNLGMDNLNPEAAEGLPDLMPLVHNVMHKLMSKELLYPSIKEIVDKYPEWLSVNGGTLPSDELENYRKQYELMKTICLEFEKDTDDCDEAKRKQFENVLQMMQKVQSYGNPPKELVANIGPGVPLDEQGNLQIPGLSQQCNIM